MNLKRVRRGRIIPALIACFYGGLATGWWAHGRAATPDATVVAAPATVAAVAREGGRATADPPPIAAPSTTIAPSTRDALAELRSRHLALPLDGVTVASMRGQFAQRRGGGSRGHEAADLLAPRGTPVHAVESGAIAKLFQSKAGGTTIYQFDPSARFCYYYAHLDAYAPGLREGQAVEAGDVIGYVGTTGNAAPNTPHLHLAIFELTPEKHWWQGTPLDPYAVFGGT